MASLASALGVDDLDAVGEAPNAVAPMDDTAGGDSPKDDADAAPPPAKRFGGLAFLVSVRVRGAPCQHPHTTRRQPTGSALRSTRLRRCVSLGTVGSTPCAGEGSTALGEQATTL